MHKILSLALIIFFALSCKAQPRTLHTNSQKAIKMYDDAGTYLDRRQYENAEKVLKAIVSTEPKFIEAYLMLGDVYYYWGKFDESIKANKDAIAIDPKAYPTAIMGLAALEQELGYFDEAVTHYEQYKTVDSKLKTKADSAIAVCKIASNLVKHPVPYNPVNVTGLNSPNNEMSVYLTADEQTAVLTVRRPADAYTEGGMREEEDLYISTFIDGKWQQAKPLPAPVNSHDNEGSQCISADGQYLFFTGCQRKEGFGRCDVYVAVKSGGVWSDPFNLGEEGVNTAAWESQPSFAADGRTLYFVSTRPGGYGGMDIWKCTLNDKGIFEKPENLGPEINTKKDDFSPYIHPDGKTLYFASKGHAGLGGSDLFISHKGADGKWEKATNLGYPINSIGDEISFYVASCSGTAYISSNKAGGVGKMDIYSFDLYKEAAPNKVTYIKGKITDKATAKPLGAIAKLTDLTTKQLVASAGADSKTGEYMVCLPSGGNYGLEISKDGYLFYSANFTLPASSDCKPYELSAALSPMKSGEAVVLRNVFFDIDKFDLKKESEVELDKLVELLQKNPTINIEISGHTDSDGDDAKNTTLSENRAKAVLDYLVKKGIDGKRLTSKGYGETKPLVKNDTPENKATNRRVEFVVK